ncbi:MAG: GntR family transcriptional regulator [Phycicoccus sp.]|nr:GntR family transcriptional regulator [Phycicoccus sp.]
MSQPGLTTVPRINLSDTVYDALRGWIMDRVLAPDSKLNIDRLAETMGVSATPVREALARLESEGLVIKEPRRGYLSTPLLSRAEMNDLFEFRNLLEPAAAARAAKRVTDEDVAALQHEITAGRAAATGDSFVDYQAAFLHDARLHEHVFRIAGSPLLAAAFERTHSHLHTFRLQTRFDQAVWARTLDEHAAIAAFIGQGDAPKARAAMREHLASSLRHADHQIQLQAIESAH